MREAFGYIAPVIIFLIAIDVARDGVRAWWHPRVLRRIATERRRRKVLRVLATMKESQDRWMESMRAFSEAADKASKSLEKFRRALDATSE